MENLNRLDTFMDEHLTKLPEMNGTGSGKDSVVSTTLTPNQEDETDSIFANLGLSNSLLAAIESAGFTSPTPVQLETIPVALKGRDVLATAQTGSGKTAAFVLPMIQKLSHKKGRYPKALVLAPTRELASQISDSVVMLSEYTPLRQVTIYGGVSQNPQVKKLRRGVDIIVATPGRFLDLFQQGHITLRDVKILVLDEADRMLDMGFINDIRRIISLIPEVRQTMMFSATMPKKIKELADEVMQNPVTVAVDPPASTVDTVESSVYFVEKSNKYNLLTHLIDRDQIKRGLVFVRTKHGANKVVKKLERDGVRAGAIHGNKSQAARTRALADFKQGRISLLVATDIAARGIDVKDISHVINFDMSNEVETYVHRIGRTARAGKSGVAYNFCEMSERSYLMGIEILIQQHLKRAEDYPYMSKINPPKLTDLSKKQPARKFTKNKNNNGRRPRKMRQRRSKF